MSTNQPVYLTPEGLQKVKDELHYLVTVRRREVAQMIAEAKAEGDLSENAGYDEAKTAQGFLEGRIRELEYTVKHGRISNESPMGQALLGKKKGQKVNVKTPGGDVKFEILKIE